MVDLSSHDELYLARLLQFALALKPDSAIKTDTASYDQGHRSKLPKCRAYFGLVVNRPPKSNGEHPINRGVRLSA